MPGPPKKRSNTSQKTSALSKRHKTSSKSNNNSKSSTGTKVHRPAALSDEPIKLIRSTGSFPADKPSRESAKKDRKGKGPAFIPVVQQESSGSDSGSDDDNDEDSDGDMEIDEDLEDMGQTDFLMKLDEKGMSVSRPSLVKAHRQEKPAPLPRRTTAMSQVPVMAPGLLKSEIKALKKKEKLKKGGKEEDEEPVFGSEDGEDEDAPKKKHKDGELVDDLEEDDLAFGSGSSDDDLSIMSEMESFSEMSDITDDSDLDGDSELDSELEGEDGLGFNDEEELEWEDEEEGNDTLASTSSGLDSIGEDANSGSDASGSDEEEDSEEDSEEDDSELSESELSDSDADSELAPRPKKVKKLIVDTDDLETAYESRPAAPKAPKARLTKLPTIVNGKAVRATSPLDRSPSPEASSSPEPEPIRKQPEYRSDPLGQRFGRPAVRQLLEIKDKKERVARAREEIADLGREASGTGEGEGGLNLLKRLISLTAPKFSSSSSAKSAGERPVMIDREIRIMAMVSLLAVFIDIIPGYRIRALTDAEKEVKVSQMVARQREWEDGLVGVYKRFLEMCESEVKEDSPLAPAACHCLCQLVQEKPDFNFAINIMDVVVKRVGRKGWDEGHQLCLATIVHLFANDTSTAATNSLHLVRLISRLVRARSFAVRPEVISTLLNLRLKEELGGGRIRASADAVFREKEGRKGIVRWNQEKDRKGRKGGKAKEAMSKVGSKKTRDARKERAGIEKEIREAEGEINTQERERNMTETLKLLFALYFRIVKLDYRTPLLPPALEGLARFSHLVNVDFFRDLLEVLKGIIKRSIDEQEEAEEEGFTKRNDQREKLLCIVTAFELLQGQGEALNIDLGDFISALYALILPLALSPTFEETPYVGRNVLTTATKVTSKMAQTEADLLFRALAAVFLIPRSLPSPIRTLAFSKRLFTSSLNWPPASQLRTVAFLRSLLIREPKLEAMLESGDRRIDGKWRGMVDEPERAEPEGTCWWEASLLRYHPDEKLRNEVKRLVNWIRD